MRMSECKRCALTVAPIEEASSSEPTVSKKRKTTATATSASFDFQLRSSHVQQSFPDAAFSPESSAGTVVSGEFGSDRSCCSSTYVKDLHTAPLDLQTNGFETSDSSHSTNDDLKSFSLLNEFSGDSEESTMFPAEISAAVSERRKVKTPPSAEIEEFFAMAEKYEQKRFAEKYNFDIVRDMPLEGRYQWVRLH